MQALEVVAAADSDDVDEVARLQSREPDLDLDSRVRRDDDSLQSLRSALGDDQPIPVADHDRAGNPADIGPDPVGDAGT